MILSGVQEPKVEFRNTYKIKITKPGVPTHTFLIYVQVGKAGGSLEV